MANTHVGEGFHPRRPPDRTLPFVSIAADGGIRAQGDGLGRATGHEAPSGSLVKGGGATPMLRAWPGTIITIMAARTFKAAAPGNARPTSGEQWTGMREAMFKALASFDRPASAYDIADTVSQAQGRRVAANSVYRILDLFVGANLADGWKAPTPMSPTIIRVASTTASS